MFVVAAPTGIALAEPAAPSADLSVNVPSPKIAVSSAQKIVRIDVTNHGPATATNAMLTLEVADVASFVDIGLPGASEHCTENAAKLTCPLGDLPADGHDHSFGIEVTPIQPAHDQPPLPRGPIGTLQVGVSSGLADPDTANNVQTVVLQLIDDGIDLATFGFDITLQPDQTDFLGFAVSNQGGRDTASIDVDVVLPKYVSFATGDIADDCDFVSSSHAVCHYDGLPAGTIGADPHALSVILAKNAPGPVALTGGSVTATGVEGTPDSTLATATTSNRQPFDTTAHGANAKAKLVNKLKLTSADASPGDETFEFTVFSTPNGADLAVAATAVTGHVGDTVTVPVTVKNNGPADSPTKTVIITAPTGTEITDGLGCPVVTPGKVVKCAGPLAALASETMNVKLKIVSATVGADGMAVVSGPLADPNPDNNTAPIKITVEAGGLPVTGVKAGVIGGVGLAGVVVGVLLYISARRRRYLLVTPADETAGE
jgi:hypothetical protein